MPTVHSLSPNSHRTADFPKEHSSVVSSLQRGETECYEAESDNQFYCAFDQLSHAFKHDFTSLLPLILTWNDPYYKNFFKFNL